MNAMSLSTLPSSPLLAANGLASPIGGLTGTSLGGPGSVPVGQGSRHASFELPLGLVTGQTLHISPHAPAWTPQQYEQAFVDALCVQPDGRR
jgi:hypothetical protein